MLGDIPIVKWLFTYEGEETVNSELVVFITPNIIEQPKMTERESTYLENTVIPVPQSPITNLNMETGKLEIPKTETSSVGTDSGSDD